MAHRLSIARLFLVWRFAGVWLALLAPTAVFAETASFDLTGPTLEVSATHGGATLPIAEVPNLSPGDQLSIRADFPPSQSVHYLLVAAFLRGATNPPPESWFFRDETWTRKGRYGLRLTVPAEAQQVLVFLAPTTGGDFKTLMGAVRGRPGAFVRASQDLNQASLDRSRLNAFLAAVRGTDASDADRLKTSAPLLARSLTVKVNTDCFGKIPALQAACLTQGQDSLVLNDGHSTSIVEALTSSAPADLALQLSASPAANNGYSSAYVAAVFDIARIMESFRTAQYQYIPALAAAEGDRLSLLLNAPPSFHSPMSVLVVALPAVEPAQAPPLRPVDPKAVFCAERRDLALPVEGAPLAFSTHYAHGMVLRVHGRDGKTLDLPVRADAAQGGFVADTRGVDPAQLGEMVEGSLHGDWGFQAFDGPAFRLQTAQALPWRLDPDDQQALIVGRVDTVHLVGQAAPCVESVSLQPPSGEAQPLEWRATAPDRLTVDVPLTGAQPGAMTLMVKSYGAHPPDAVPLQAFTQAGHLESFAYHEGDGRTGSRLDEVAGLTLGGVAFTPGLLSSAGGQDTLSLTADAASASRLKAGQSLAAKVALKDGRAIGLKSTVEEPRPQVALIGKSVEARVDGPIAIQLGDPGELPQKAKLTFSVQADQATRFGGRLTDEVAPVPAA